MQKNLKETKNVFLTRDETDPGSASAEKEAMKWFGTSCLWPDVDPALTILPMNHAGASITSRHGRHAWGGDPSASNERRAPVRQPSATFHFNYSERPNICMSARKYAAGITPGDSSQPSQAHARLQPPPATTHASLIPRQPETF